MNAPRLPPGATMSSTADARPRPPSTRRAPSSGEEEEAEVEAEGEEEAALNELREMERGFLIGYS